MTEEIRNILDPSCTYSDECVLGLLNHAQSTKTGVWDTVKFFIRHGQLQLAVDFLREQGDLSLCKLADVLPRLFAELDRMEAGETSPSSVYHIQQVGQLNPSATDINNNFHKAVGT